MNPSDNYLIHHGILGMKWGVRRYQNYDGTLTAAGRKRYSTGSEGTTSVSDMDHSKSNRSEFGWFIASLGLDVMRLNPIGLGVDLVRGGKAVNSVIKNHSYLNERKNESVDKATGLYKKNRTMTPQQDMARVNPLRYNFDKNTKNNCVLCTVAYDMRRRGFDVQANKASYGYSFDDITNWYPKAKVERIQGTYGDKTRNRKAVYDMGNRMVSSIQSQGDGARGQITFTFSKGFSGHSVSYEVINGNVVIRDAQVAKTYTNALSYLTKKDRGSFATYARLDNVEFDPQRIKEAVS